MEIGAFARAAFNDVATYILQQVQRLFAGDTDLPHVGHIKHPARLAHGFMFGNDTIKLDGQEPPVKIYHFSAGGLTGAAQGGFFKCVCHKLIV